MWVCTTATSDASMTPSSMRLVCSAVFFTFRWCPSNRSVPEHRRRWFIGLRCQLTINFQTRFTSEFLFSCHCVSDADPDHLLPPHCLQAQARAGAWYTSCRDDWCRRKRLQCDVHLVRSTDSAEVLPPSCSWMPLARLIFLECDVVSSVDQCCN